MSSRNTIPTIITTSLTHTQTIRFLSLLSPLLPYSIPLARRIQWSLLHPPPSAEIDQVETILVISQPTDHASHGTLDNINAHDLIDTWLQSRLSLDSVDSLVAESAKFPWIAAHVDLSSPGTTQGWLFGSWELPSTSSPDSDPASALNLGLHKDLLNHVFRHIHSTLVPNRSLSPPETWLWLRDNGKWLSQPYSRAKVLFGTVHESIRHLIVEEATARRDGWYDKWIFPRGAFSHNNTTDRNAGSGNSASQLPEGYTFGMIKESELQTILDGSPIPRTLKYLKEVVSAGVYLQPVSSGDQEGQPTTTTANITPELVAYGFLNKDASLGGLLVQPPHRGKGLAVTLSAELFRLQEDTFQSNTSIAHSAPASGEPPSRENGVRNGEASLHNEEQNGWFSHSDVGDENDASRRVMQKLGGKKMWRVCWVEVDLDVVVGVKERYE